MADRIIAALEYLDAHTSIVLQKQKHRSLGDLDAKYDVVDPTELPLNSMLGNTISLAGTTRTNLSREKTIDQILEEDREKVVQSAHRTKSAPSRKSNLQSRPQTSLSSASGFLHGENRRQNFRPASQATSTASKTSVKRLSFTSPGVNVGPSDARDEVMEDIVNKPLTHSPTKARSAPTRARTSASSPSFGRQGRVSIGCRSLTSLKRSKTFHSGSKKSDSLQRQYEKKPGPFTTVKVSGSDMWVVSDSTPTSYFNGDIPKRSMTNGSATKTSSWEETADAVPREEKKSPPRFQRQLGAPPQFGPTQQWYTFSGRHPSKERPVLSAFADETENEYYNIESRVGRIVASHLEASPGIRIGVNGEVVSKSMKVTKKPKTKNSSGSESTYSDDDAHSDDGSGGRGNTKETEIESVRSESPHNSKNSNVEESDVTEKPQKDDDIITSEVEDKKFSLLRYLGIANGENPYVTESGSDATSSGDVTSLLNSICKNDKSSKRQNGEMSDSDELIWKVLEGASPTLWLNKQKWREMREQMAKRRAKHFALGGEENLGPLSWKEQLDRMEGKVVEARLKQDKVDSRGNNDTVPVVFNKLFSYDQLPTSFVHVTPNGYRPHSSVSAVDRNLDLSPPSKGFTPTVAFSPRAIKSAGANGIATSASDDFSPRPFTAQAQLKAGNQDNSGLEHGLDVADILLVANDSMQGKLPDNEPTSDVHEDNVEKFDDVSHEELEAVRLEAAYNMKMMGGEGNSIMSRQDEKTNPSPRSMNAEKSDATERISRRNPDRSVTLNSLPMKAGATIATVDIRPSAPKSSMPVSSLNLVDYEDKYIVNGPNPPSPSSPMRNAFGEPLETPPNSVVNLIRNGQSPPANTPKTPSTHKGGYEVRSPRNDLSSSHESRHYSSEMTRSAPYRHGSKSASLASRSPGASPRSNVIQLSTNSNLPRQATRASGGFMASPLTGRPNVSKHASSGRFGSGIAKPVKPTSPNSPSIIPHGNTYADFVTRSGFIQISHSLHIPSQRSSSAGGSGNKMYDSYMRELSSRSGTTPGGGNYPAGKSNGIMGKSLGGTSGKIVSEHLRPKSQNPVTSSSSPMSKIKGSYPNFSARAGRRSGLAITNEHLTHAHNTQAASSGATISNGLGLQGDQVRLNLDKNIHVIYRDLGILKKSSKNLRPGSPLQSKPMPFEMNNAGHPDRHDARSVGRRSDGSRSRPHSHSSKSGRDDPMREGSESYVVNIPTAPSTPAKEEMPDHVNIKQLEPMEKRTVNGTDHVKLDMRMVQDDKAGASKSQGTPNIQDGLVVKMDQNNNVETPDEVRALSAQSRRSRKSEVVDSGTQWSPHEVVRKAIEVERNVDATGLDHGKVTDDAYESIPQIINNPPQGDAEKLDFNSPNIASFGDGENVSSEDTQETTPSPDAQVNKERESNVVDATVEEKDVVEENVKIAKKDETIIAKEEEEQDQSEGLRGRRSVSDSQLHLAGKEEAEQVDVVDKIVADEELDVRGVTKVTVNIAPAVKS